MTTDKIYGGYVSRCFECKLTTEIYRDALCLRCYPKRKDENDIEFYITNVPNPHKAITRSMRDIILERDNNRCRVCGTGDNLDIHHLDKDTKNNDAKNLIMLCCYCHSKMPEHKHYVNLIGC